MRRLCLVLRDGTPLFDKADSGSPATNLTGTRPLTAAQRNPFGRVKDIDEGHVYGRKHLLDKGALTSIQGGISGTKTLGCCAIVVKRQSSHLDEADGFDTLHYAATTRQGARAMVLSQELNKPIRVFRSSDLGNAFACATPAADVNKFSQSYRYDGLYRINHFWQLIHHPDTLCFRLVRQEKGEGPLTNALETLELLRIGYSRGTVHGRALQCRGNPEKARNHSSNATKPTPKVTPRDALPVKVGKRTWNDKAPPSKEFIASWHNWLDSLLPWHPPPKRLKLF